MDENFKWEDYINLYKDLSNAGINTKEKALEHWNKYGKKEGRKCSKKEFIFDWKKYIELYIDLQKANINTKQQALTHWINHGEKEGRIYPKKELLFEDIKVGIYVRCKNEANIIEFMDHYYKLGFDIIIFYDDNSSPSILDIIKTEVGDIYKGKYKIIRNESSADNLNNSNFFMGYMLSLLKENMDYCLYIDMDEYLKINGEENIKQLIKSYHPFDSLKINWLLFGNNDIIKCDNLKNIKNIFTKSSTKFHNHVKSLVKLENINGYINPHCFRLIEDSIVKNVLGEVVINNHFEEKLTNYSFKDVKFYLGHYIVQGIHGFVTRRFGRLTLNVLCYKYPNLPEFVNSNIDNICNYIHENNINHIKYMSQEQQNIIAGIKGFLDSHNGKDEYNKIE